MLTNIFPINAPFKTIVLYSLYSILTFHASWNYINRDVQNLNSHFKIFFFFFLKANKPPKPIENQIKFKINNLWTLVWVVQTWSVLPFRITTWKHKNMFKLLRISWFHKVQNFLLKIYNLMNKNHISFIIHNNSAISSHPPLSIITNFKTCKIADSSGNPVLCICMTMGTVAWELATIGN